MGIQLIMSGVALRIINCRILDNPDKMGLIISTEGNSGNSGRDFIGRDEVGGCLGAEVRG